MTPSLTPTQKNWASGILAVFALLGGLYIHTVLRRQEDTRREERKAVVCPSLLSIARSSRDTMIVMKNERLCNDFVMENLQ